MTHPATPEVGGEEPSVELDARETFENIASEWLGEEPEQEPAEGEGDEPETTDEADDDLELEAEADDLPPIEAPVSWDAEAKEVFANLPREAQEIVTKREAERERFVQQKSQDAARARQETERVALQQLAQIEQTYAQQFQQVAQQITPQRPDPAMLQYDPQGFYAQQANYENALAQQQQLQHQAQAYAHQAAEREHLIAQQEAAQEQQIVAEHFPEYLDPTTGPALRQELSTVARELGYPSELIEQARATDIIAMKKVADLKRDADKYRALMAKKMEKVRAAKGLPKVAKPGMAVPADRARQNRANAAWERTKSATNIGDRSDAFADYLKSTGQL
jgi:uncharacterized protein YbbK (DUF523 family)